MHLSVSPGSKNLKKGVQNRLEPKNKIGTQKGHLALSKCQLAQIMGTAWGLLDWDKSDPFLFF